MNLDEFEKKLKSQQMREVPREWRREIVVAALAERGAQAGRGVVAAPTFKKSWWRELLWPCPQAWAGLACVWMLVAVLQAASREPSTVVATGSSPESLQSQFALSEQRRLLAELLDPVAMADSPVDRPRSKPVGPRSQREVVVTTV